MRLLLLVPWHKHSNNKEEKGGGGGMGDRKLDFSPANIVFQERCEEFSHMHKVVCADSNVTDMLP